MCFWRWIIPCWAEWCQIVALTRGGFSRNKLLSGNCCQFAARRVVCNSCCWRRGRMAGKVKVFLPIRCQNLLFIVGRWCCSPTLSFETQEHAEVSPVLRPSHYTISCGALYHKCPVLAAWSGYPESLWPSLRCWGEPWEFWACLHTQLGSSVPQSWTVPKGWLQPAPGRQSSAVQAEFAAWGVIQGNFGIW